MARYRKKPVVIDAIQFDGSNGSAIAAFFGQTFHNADRGDRTSVLAIPTLEGVMTASAGDWIIKGVKGEFYPCKPDIFAATYEAV